MRGAGWRRRCLRWGLSCGVALAACLGGDPSPASAQTSAAAEVGNPEIAALFDADQQARQNVQGVDWDKLGAEDAERRRQVLAMINAGELHTGADFYKAAFIFQHGVRSGDFLLAHTLAMLAMGKGADKAGWIAAASLDRYLLSVQQPQIFATQYQRVPIGPPVLSPVDGGVIPDTLRPMLGLPPVEAGPVGAGKAP